MNTFVITLGWFGETALLVVFVTLLFLFFVVWIVRFIVRMVLG